MRQPGGVLPAAFAVAVGEQIDLQVPRALQDGQLPDKPARHQARPLAGAGHPDHARDGEGERRGDVGRHPVRGAAVFHFGHVLDADPAAQVRGTHPDQQVIGVGPAPLPEPAARVGGSDQQLGRVRAGPAPVHLLHLERGRDVRLDRGQELPMFGELPSEALLPLSAAGDAVGQHDDRRHRGDQQIHGVVEKGRHQDAEHRRQGRGDPRHRAAHVGLGLHRQFEGGPALRRQDARGPVVVQPPAVRLGLNHRVGRADRVHLDQRRADPQLHPGRPPGRYRGQRLTVQFKFRGRAGHARQRAHLDPRVQAHRARNHRRRQIIAQADSAVGVGAENELPGTQPGDGAGIPTGHDPDGDQPDTTASATRRAVDGQYRAVEDAAGAQGLGQVERLVAQVEGVRIEGGRMDLLAHHRDDVAQRRGRVRLDDVVPLPVTARLAEGDDDSHGRLTDARAGTPAPAHGRRGCRVTVLVPRRGCGSFLDGAGELGIGVL